LTHCFRSKPSWNTIVSTSRPHSTSPTQIQRIDCRPSSTKKSSKPNPPIEQQRSQSLTSTDGIIQTKQQEKRPKRPKNKAKERPPVPEPTPFSLDDENAFPTLGQEISISLPKKSDTAKDNGKIFSIYISILSSLISFYSRFD